MGLIKEFKTFAIKGNAIDLAIGVVIGAAFSSITNSLVNDIINPPLGLLTGKVDFADKAIVLREAVGTTSSAITLNYGAFINTVINFLIVAFALFIVVREMNRLRERVEKKSVEDEEQTKAPEPPAEVKLLAEIRDELQKLNKTDHANS